MALTRRGLLDGPDLNATVGKLLQAMTVDKKLKEPLRKGLKSWQAAVLARMKADAPDDPETGESRIEKALRAKAPTISRGRGRITASFEVDAAKLGASAHGKDKSAGRGVAWSLVQHEDLTIRHRRGNAKFMERPFVQFSPRVAQVVEDAFAEIAANLERA